MTLGSNSSWEVSHCQYREVSSKHHLLLAGLTQWSPPEWNLFGSVWATDPWPSSMVRRRCPLFVSHSCHWPRMYQVHYAIDFRWLFSTPCDWIFYHSPLYQFLCPEVSLVFIRVIEPGLDFWLLNCQWTSYVCKCWDNSMIIRRASSPSLL